MQVRIKNDGKSVQSLTLPEFLFVEKIWKPTAFKGELLMRAESPLRSVGSNPQIMGFWFTGNGARLFIEISGYCLEQLNPQEHCNYSKLHNDLMLAGWQVLRLDAEQILGNPVGCQKLLRRALNFAQSQKKTPPIPASQDLWKIREQQIIEMARYRNGKLRPEEVAAEFNVSIRSAAEWLVQFAKEGVLSFISGSKFAKVYILNEATFNLPKV